MAVNRTEAATFRPVERPTHSVHGRDRESRDGIVSPSRYSRGGSGGALGRRQGRLSTMRHTKIVCTIGPSSSDVATLDRLVAAGMDVARLNFSHGTHAEHAEVIQRLRAAEERWRRPIAILQDLQGPKIRLGTFGPAGGDRVDLESGQRFTLVPERVAGTRERASVAPPDCLRELKPGDAILMDDGMIQLEVEDAADDAVHCRVVAGGRISDHKGISFAHVPLPISCLTDKDRDDLI